MSEKKIDELQKLYDNPRIGAFVQEICEYYATSDSYEDNSYQEEIEPRDLTEAVYTLFCLQCRERVSHSWLENLDPTCRGVTKPTPTGKTECCVFFFFFG